MDFIWWFLALVLMAVGLIGTVLPVVPGAIIILAAAIIHQVMLGTEKSLGWWNVAALVLLTLLSYALNLRRATSARNDLARRNGARSARWWVPLSASSFLFRA